MSGQSIITRVNNGTRILCLSGFVLCAILCGGGNALHARETLTLYSHRHYPLDKEIFATFEEKHGVRISVLHAGAGELIERLAIEKERTKADILVTVSAARLDHAAERGLLSPISSATVAQHIPAQLRHPRNYWVALTMRARVIVYNPRHASAADLAQYANMAERAWRGKLAMRSSVHAYNTSLLAGMIYRDGMQEATEWTQSVANNLAYAARGNDRDQIRAVARGHAAATLVNSYYYGILSDTEPHITEAVEILFPNQETHGTHIDVSGLGIVRYSEHKELATKLIEFLTSAAVQSRYAAENYEFPANPRARSSGLVEEWRKMHFDYDAVGAIPRYYQPAARILTASGW